MDDKELRSYEMLMRVDNFGDENTASFPTASLGRISFGAVKEAVAKLANSVAQQVPEALRRDRELQPKRWLVRR